MINLSEHNIRLELARRDILDFTIYTYANSVSDVTGVSGFRVNWHHRVICEEVMKWVNRETENLMLCTPPRHGKSEIISRRLPAFLLGRNPDAQIAAISYTMDLSRDMSRSVQNIMVEKEYKTLFPETRLREKSSRATERYDKRTLDEWNIKNRQGTYKAGSISSGITGRGFGWVIIDDPIKGEQQALSSTYKDQLWRYYKADLSSRVHPSGGKLLCATRWADDDLCGRILNDSEEKNRWKVVTLRALRRESDKFDYDPRKAGELLWPDVWPESVLRPRMNGPLGLALYQQDPVAEGGNIFQTKWLSNFWTPSNLPSRFDSRIQSWDMSFGSKTGTASYVVGQVWGKKGAHFYLLDQVRGRWDLPETISKFLYLTHKWDMKGDLKLVENKGNGPAVMQMLGSSEYGVPAILPINPTEDKIARAMAITPIFESGNVLLPVPGQVPWVQEYMDEFLRFPYGTDDQVDTTSQALSKLLSYSEVRFESF